MSASELHVNGSPKAPRTLDQSDHEPAITPRRKVRTLFINDTARNGGPGRSLFYILKFLDPAVVQRTVVLPREGVIADILRGGGVVDQMLFEPHLVENPIEPWNRPMEREDYEAALAVRGARAAGNVGRVVFALSRLASLVRRGQFDLIYCNGTNANFAGGALAWMTGVPALWHVRYTSIPRAVRGVHDRLAQSPGVRRIVCVSAAAASLFGGCKDKVRVIHNALDIDEFNAERVTPCLRAELGIGADAVVFGSQGRVLRRKGYVEMIQAAKLALDRMTDTERARAHFVVIGDTPADFKPDHVEECRALARSLGIEGKVHMLGFRSDVKPLVADFDVAVVPSVYPDPLPRAVIESMAMSKPVVAFAVGGVVEMVEDGRTGALVSGAPADVSAMADAMVRYVRDAGLRVKHGKAARARIERDFDGAAHGRKIQNEIVRAAGLG